MTKMWATATYAVFSATELFWCVECENDEIFDRPGGADAAEAFCVSCGYAVFLWVDTADAEWSSAQPAASSTTPMSAVATPAA